MQAKHFIDVLIETYERAWSAYQADQISEQLELMVLEAAVWAADQVATNNWHGAADRAGAVAAAMVRALHGENAAAEAEGLHAFVRLHIGDAQDPEVRIA